MPYREPIIRTIENPTAEELRAFESARSPLEFVSQADRQKYHDELIAVISEGPHKGTVIAHVLANLENPDIHRKEIVRQIHASPFNGSPNTLYDLPGMRGEYPKS